MSAQRTNNKASELNDALCYTMYSIPAALATASRMAIAPSFGAESADAGPPNFPMGVRAKLTMTASCFVFFPPNIMTTPEKMEYWSECQRLKLRSFHMGIGDGQTGEKVKNKRRSASSMGCIQARNTGNTMRRNPWILKLERKPETVISNATRLT